MLNQEVLDGTAFPLDCRHRSHTQDDTCIHKTRQCPCNRHGKETHPAVYTHLYLQKVQVNNTYQCFQLNQHKHAFLSQQIIVSQISATSLAWPSPLFTSLAKHSPLSMLDTI